MAGTVVLIEITRDRPDYPAFQRLAGGLAERALEIAGENYEAKLIHADEFDLPQLVEQTEGAAAVVFLGGEDVAPSLYGGTEDYQGKGPHHPLVDERQAELIRHLAGQRTPVLGICRGAQIVNVALGGTLVQHLEVPGHRNPGILKDYTMATHEVTLEGDSRVGRAMSIASSAVSRGDGALSVEVQSAHHQAIDALGEGLRVVGRSGDGVIEAVEHEAAPILAVQWHPEDPNTSGEQVTFLLRVLTEGR